MSDDGRQEHRSWQVRRFFVVGLLAVLTDFGLAWALDHARVRLAEAEAWGPAPRQRSLPDLLGWYRWLVTAGPRRPIARYTTVVSIEPTGTSNVPSLHEICAQREFLGHLVGKISEAKPAAIVIDKYFDPSLCPDHPSSSRLREAVRDVGRTTPVIVGVGLGPVEEARTAENNFRPLRRLAPSLFTQGPGLSLGSVNVHPDDRRLAFGWAVWDVAGENVVWQPSLALVASVVVRPDMLERDLAVKGMIKEGIHPYVSFISRDELPQMSAAEVLCGESSVRISDWRACLTKPLSEAARSRLRSSVVVIGEVHDTFDQHRSVVGKVPGVFLQANFIEALLDGRVYKPMPRWFDAIFGALIAVLCGLVVEHVANARRIVLATGAILATSVAIIVSLAILCGRFTNPLVASATGILLLVVGSLVRKVASGEEAKPS